MSETKEPENAPIVPPLPCPREPPPVDETNIDPSCEDGSGILRIDVSSMPLDIGTDMEEESDDAAQWQTVQTRTNKNKVLVKLKVTPSLSKRKSFEAGEGSMSGKDAPESRN